VKGFGYKMADLEPGKIISFKSFLSTTSEVDIAKDFTDKDSPVILNIVTKAGVPIRINFSEHEYLLPRDKKFAVSKVEENVHIIGRLDSFPGVTLVTLKDV
jgi:hypothetical protein